LRKLARLSAPLYHCEAMRALVIIATYNEGGNIESLADKILKLPHSLDVLVVDDNSPDGTGKIADRLAEKTGRVFVIHRPEKLGLGNALRAGMVWAVERGYEIACTMDADHSHAPKYLPDMIEIAKSADVVIGSRYVPGGGVRKWPLGRKILSKMANFYARTVMGLKIKDCTSGYRIYSGKFLASLQLDRITSGGHSFLVELIWEAEKNGFTVKEFPIIFVDRIKGISKMTPREILSGIFNILSRRLSSGKK